MFSFFHFNIFSRFIKAATQLMYLNSVLGSPHFTPSEICHITQLTNGTKIPQNYWIWVVDAKTFLCWGLHCVSLKLLFIIQRNLVCSAV